MRTPEEIQNELNKLKKVFNEHIKALNEPKNKELPWDKVIINNISNYHNDIMVLEWVLGNADHY